MPLHLVSHLNPYLRTSSETQLFSNRDAHETLVGWYLSLMRPVHTLSTFLSESHEPVHSLNSWVPCRRFPKLVFDAILDPHESPLHWQSELTKTK